MGAHAHGHAPSTHAGGHDDVGGCRILLIIAVVHGVQQIGNQIAGEHLSFVGMTAENQIGLGGVLVDVVVAAVR